MAKVKVLVLYPSAFTSLGIEVEGSDTVSVEESDAVTLVGAGWAEYVKQPRTVEQPRSTVKTETADVKLTHGRKAKG
jgi:hypothetical protein